MFKQEEYDADFNNGVMSRVGVARYDVLNVECVISLLICIIFRCVNVAFFHTKTCVKYSPLGNCRISFLSVHDYLSSSNLNKRVFLFKRVLLVYFDYASSIFAVVGHRVFPLKFHEVMRINLSILDFVFRRETT